MVPWLGLAFTAYGGWLLYQANSHRLRALANPAAADRAEGKLTIMVEMLPGLINFGLVIAAVEVVIGYRMLGPIPAFGPLDLAGLLFMLASYGVWINVKCRMRPGQSSP